MNYERLILSFIAGALVVGGVMYALNRPDTSKTDGADTITKNPDTPPPDTVTVKTIFDPITIQAESGHVIRYVGVRAPSTISPVQCYAKEALEINESIIGKMVRLEQEPLIDRSQDGAWVRYVFLPEDPTPTPEPTPVESPDVSLEKTAQDFTEGIQSIASSNEGGNETEDTPTPEPTPEGPKEILINERILEGGFGFPVVSQDMKYGERLLSAAKFASATSKGLWGTCEVTGEVPNLTTQNLDSCDIKGKVTQSGDKIYRTNDCPGYAQTIVLQSEGGNWFCAEDLAQDAGFTKASDCK